MFSGIIESLGSIDNIEDLGGDKRLVVEPHELDLNDIKIGDSVSINGACLTVININQQYLAFDVSNETLNCTNLGNLENGSLVNIERALRLSDRLNGHFVTGHVDTVGKVVKKQEEARSWQYEIQVTKQYMRYISRKGSVAVDGVSLTVNDIDNDIFSVNIIPHTQEHTLFKLYNENTEVNIEVDMLSRYIERLLDNN